MVRGRVGCADDVASVSGWNHRSHRAGCAIAQRDIDATTVLPIQSHNAEAMAIHRLQGEMSRRDPSGETAPLDAWEKGREMVLCSGGWESTAVALLRKAPLLFVDYGQSYAQQERAAVQRLASALDVPLLQVTTAVNRKERNFDMMKLAKDNGATRVALGCRAISALFDRYGDCHRAALQRAADKLDIEVVLPLIGMPNFMVHRIVKRGLCQRVVFSSKGLVM